MLTGYFRTLHTCTSQKGGKSFKRCCPPNAKMAQPMEKLEGGPAGDRRRRHAPRSLRREGETFHPARSPSCRPTTRGGNKQCVDGGKSPLPPPSEFEFVGTSPLLPHRAITQRSNQAKESWRGRGETHLSIHHPLNRKDHLPPPRNPSSLPTKRRQITDQVSGLKRSSR